MREPPEVLAYRGRVYRLDRTADVVRETDAQVTQISLPVDLEPRSTRAWAAFMGDVPEPVRTPHAFAVNNKPLVPTLPFALVGRLVHDHVHGPSLVAAVAGWSPDVSLPLWPIRAWINAALSADAVESGTRIRIDVCKEGGRDDDT